MAWDWGTVVPAATTMMGAIATGIFLVRSTKLSTATSSQTAERQAELEKERDAEKLYSGFTDRQQQTIDKLYERLEASDARGAEALDRARAAENRVEEILDSNRAHHRFDVELLRQLHAENPDRQWPEAPPLVL